MIQLSSLEVNMSVYRYRYHRKIYYFIRLRINGKQLSRRLDKGKRFSSEEEAREYERNLILSSFSRDVQKNDYVYLLDSSFTKFIVDKYSEGTAYSFVRIWKRFFYKNISQLKLCDLSENIFIDLNNKINNLKVKDKHQYISLGKNFLKFLHRYNIVISESVFYQSRKKELFESKEIEFWSLSEFNKFISSVDDIFYRLLFTILYYYGLRIGELRAIKKVNFTKDKLIIDSMINNKTLLKKQIVSKTKTQSSNRQFPMLTHVYDLYKEYLFIYNCSSPFVFFSFLNSKVVGETTIRRKLIHYCQKSGVKYIHPHSFRHSCASLLINNGMDYLQVSSWLGHSSPSVTLKIYSHLFDSRKNEIFDFLNNINKKDG